MASKWNWLVIDANDPRSLAGFWRQALDFKVLEEDDDYVTLGMDNGTFPQILLMRVPEGKTGKNRVHIDLTPDDQAAEVDRLIGLGARHADIGQHDTTWVVLADPEGNEFCVLRADQG